MKYRDLVPGDIIAEFYYGRCVRCGFFINFAHARDLVPREQIHDITYGMVFLKLGLIYLEKSLVFSNAVYYLVKHNNARIYEFHDLSNDIRLSATTALKASEFECIDFRQFGRIKKE